MVDLAYADSILADLYDALNPWGPGDDFYLDLAMSAPSVLDVGCGTGALLRRAREASHPGRLCGLDPAEAMLEVARTRRDVEWVRGDLGSVGWDRDFDLVVLTGHAFQVFVSDDEIRATLTAVRSALADGGLVAFETRNPAVRPWEAWTPENGVEVADAAGAVVRVEHHVETPVDGDVVRFVTTFTSPGWDRPRVSASSLRFLDAAALRGVLSVAGLVVEAQYGDWAGNALTDTSPEIVTLARRA